MNNNLTILIDNNSDNYIIKLLNLFELLRSLIEEEINFLDGKL